MKARGLTPRQAFTMLAVVLALALVALVVYLALYLAPEGLVTGGGEVKAGIRPVLTIEGPGAGEVPRFSRPLGAALAPDGTIYVSDTGNNRVCVFAPDGTFRFEFGGQGIAKPAPGVEATWDEGEMNFPAGIDVDENGDVYLADFRNDQIQVFAADGTFLRRFPDPSVVLGKGASGQDGTGIAVTDIAVADGKVYATDAYQVFVFTTDGELIAQFGMPGSDPGDIDHPNGIDVGEDGVIYIADSNNNRVQAFDADFELLWATGERVTDLSKESDNEFALPRGVTVTDRDELIVADSFEFSLVTLDPDGAVVGRSGQRGVDPGEFNFPNSVDDLGRRLLVADKENDRVQLLELVSE